MINTWIPCAEQLPDSDVTVLAYVPDSGDPILQAYHNGVYWMDLTLDVPITDVGITHWMYHPDPPEAQP